MKKILEEGHLGLIKLLMEKIPRMINDLKKKYKALSNIEDSDVKKRLQDEVKASEVRLLIPDCFRFFQIFQGCSGFFQNPRLLVS